MGMQSLRDKLLKAGLVSEQDAKKAEAEKAKPPPAVRAPPPRGPARDEPRLPRLPPLAGTKEANRVAARKQLELDRRIREQVLATQVTLEPGETTFYFVTRKNKLRRLLLSADQAKALEEGRLAVVERPDPDKIEHALVPPEVAAELLTLSDKVVRFLNREGKRVGFLTDEEIHARASEADAPDAATATSTEGSATLPTPGAGPAHPDDGAAGRADAAARATDGAAPKEPSEVAAAARARAEPSTPSETWITIKRAPK